MAADRIPGEIASESDVSMVLNTLMYVNDFPKSSSEKSVCGLLDDMGKHYGSYSDEQKASYDAVFQYVYGKKPELKTVTDSDGIQSSRVINATYEDNGHPDVGSLVYHSHSANGRGVKDGAIGGAFYSTDSSGNPKDIYVAYRGTGDGRWYDNGDAFAKKYSPYQQDAAEYFDFVMEDLGVTDANNVYVTGHSKGGNQAQFVTLASKNAYLVDKCISMDGEGFSPEAIAYFKIIYGEDFYEGQLQKMYAVCGDNDYVNVLGIKVIPEDHTVYVKSPTDVYDLPNGHGLVNTKTGTGNLFNFETGSFYEQTSQQRELALFAKSLSENIMNLPPEQREDVCRSLMSLLEYAFSGGAGLNGESATTEELLGFFSYVDVVVDELLYTQKGQDFINKSVNELIRSKLPFDENTTAGKIATFIVVGYIQGHLQGALYVAEYILDGLSEIIATGAKVVDAFRVAFEFCGNVVNGLKELYKYVTDSDYRAAQEYLSYAMVIKLHTDDLHGLAERLWAVNGRLESLDHRLDNLYKRVKWTDLWNLMRADFKIGWSPKINSCANCLNDTANRFESAEQQILGLMG
ncbi:MAG TPA: DUF2974 domain-containing protein [Ruminococcus sp.]|nr:DUF2974 domain-containing protein [Ruminococcus sp.]